VPSSTSNKSNTPVIIGAVVGGVVGVLLLVGGGIAH